MKARERALVAVLALLAMAPTPGDVGGCGQPAEELDVQLFLRSMNETDCTRCEACGIATATCAAACAKLDVPQRLPEGCAPLAHDGEVCLRRLQADACGAYESYVADQGGKPTPLLDRPRPSECQFCPPP